MIDLQSWESSVLGQHLDTDGVKADTGQCSQVSINWAMANNPGIPWTKLLKPLGSNASIGDWAGQSTSYYTWVANNKKDINQLPLPGDIMVFTNHTGVCKTASPSGYTIIEQNAPQLGSGVHDTSYAWNFRNCLGWFRSVNQYQHAPIPVPIPAPTMSTIVGKTLHLPATNPDGSPDNVWHVYHEDGPYDYAHAVGKLDPAMFGGLSYQILADKGNGIYAIQTQDFGRVAIWTSGTNATVS